MAYTRYVRVLYHRRSVDVNQFSAQEWVKLPLDSHYISLHNLVAHAIQLT